jgi:hypothetical protein
MHTLEGTPSIVASQYEGSEMNGIGDDPDIVCTATIEPRLQQLGQRDPRIDVYLCRGHRDRAKFEKVLRPSLDDAQELIVALNYLIKVAVST